MQRTLNPQAAPVVTALPQASRDRSLTMLWAWLVVLTLLVAQANAVEPLASTTGHPLYHRSLPPGGVWKSPAATRVHHSTFQPVAFSGPEGTQFSLPQQGAFAPGEARLMAGLMVGAVYRFRVTRIPFAPAAELYPTVELIGRTFPPPGLETRFPIPINLSETDLEAALRGDLVTRVIYLEDPQTAPPLAQEVTDAQPIDLPPNQDALATADALGRPVAIVRMGSVTPPDAPALQPQFYFGYPAWAPIFSPEPEGPSR